MNKSILCNHPNSELQVVSLFGPDLSSLSNFPRRAFKRPSKVMLPPKRPHMVRFNSTLNDEFVIQSRCSQEHSVSTEELMNRILGVRREINDTLDDMEDLDQDEWYLEDQVDVLRRDQETCGMLHAKKILSALLSRSKHIAQETHEMRMSMLVIKGKSRQLQNQLDALNPQTSGLFWIAKSMWKRATTTTNPLPFNDDNARTAAAKCA